jgi:endonuclease YncB( thermonuclease family)
MKNLSTLTIAILFFVTISFGQNNYPRLSGDYVSNYDGDTFTCTVWVISDKDNFTFEERTIKVRILNVDTYEIHKRSQTPVQNQKAQEAKEFTRRLLSKGKIDIHPKYKDRYGRLVCEVYPWRSFESMSELLKMEGLTTGRYEDDKIKNPIIGVFQTKDKHK